MFAALTALEGIQKDLQPEDLGMPCAGWERQIINNRRFIKITPQNTNLLSSLLKKEKDQDSFLASPVYYMFTGRRGLWLYGAEESYIPLCWHPNVNEQILIFPPRGRTNHALLKELLTEIPVPTNGIRIARIKSEEIQPLWITEATGTLQQDFSFSAVQEDVLDWRYPIRVLSTEQTSKLQGGHFAKTRNHIRQLEKLHIEVRPFSKELKSQVMDFAFVWAEHKATNRSEIAELLAPYEEILRLYDEGFSLSGLVFYIDGSVQAFSMWEPSHGDTEIANAWITLCNTSHNGLSDLVIKTLADTLYTQGVPFLNFGGSELESLDNFKKKFLPAYSLGLYSVDVRKSVFLRSCEPVLTTSQTKAA